MTEEEILFARRVLQGKWLSRDVVNACLQERKSRAGRERAAPLWDLLLERRLLTPAQVRAIQDGAPSGAMLPAPPGVEIQVSLDRDPLGERFRGRWIADNRSVEIRRVAPALSEQPLYRRRFLGEGAALVSLPAHPAIARVRWAGDSGDALYRVTESQEGEPSSRILSRGDRMSEESCLAVIGRALEGLAHLSARGLTHRDLRPDTLLLAHSGGVVLLEPALAPAAATEAGGGREFALRAPAYRSPEQLRGERPATIADDLHALGACAYHLTAGEPPFPGDSAEAVARRILAEPAADVRAVRAEVSYGFALFVRRLMSQDSADRIVDPRSAGKFLAEVRRGKVREPVRIAPSAPTPAFAEEGSAPAAVGDASAPGAGSAAREGEALASRAPERVEESPVPVDGAGSEPPPSEVRAGSGVSSVPDSASAAGPPVADSAAVVSPFSCGEAESVGPLATPAAGGVAAPTGAAVPTVPGAEAALSGPDDSRPPEGAAAVDGSTGPAAPAPAFGATGAGRRIAPATGTPWRLSRAAWIAAAIAFAGTLLALTLLSAFRN